MTNNVEVIQSQQALAAANDQYIASLYEHNIAKVLLARAIGNAEQVVKQYLAEPATWLRPANVNDPPIPRPNTTPAPVPNPQTPQTPGPEPALKKAAIRQQVIRMSPTTRAEETEEEQ